MEVDSDQQRAALRLKTIAETKYTDSNIKSALKHIKKAHRLCPNLDGVSSMLTAFKILQVASKTQSDISDWYKILQVEPFSHINTIKKEYKRLALNLHPDKNSYLGCEEAFKLVGEGFRVLSDKIKRKEYDMRLRIKLQEERVNDYSVVETFWTACSRCRLLHQFERRYLGHNLVCPSCKQSFEAVEVEERDKEEHGIADRVRVRSERLRRKVVVGEEGIEELGGNLGSSKKMASVGSRRKVGGGQIGSQRARSENCEVKEDGSGEWGGGRLRNGGLRRKMSTVDEVLERSKPKRVKFGEEMMTLAQMRLEAKQRVIQERAKMKEKQKDVRKKTKEKEEKEKLEALTKLVDRKVKKDGVSKKTGVVELEAQDNLDENRNLDTEGRGASRKSASMRAHQKGLRRRDSEIMTIEDSEFYDFNRDRGERSFRKGQVWAIYDDDDGLPRCYGLIEEVISLNPFQVKLSWLDLQSDGDEGLIGWKKKGFHVPCGRFKVSRKTTIKSLNVFSHVVDCERAAREVYRIYPVKGSVWALHNEVNFGAEERNTSARDKECFEIVVILTSYSEMYGLSIACLERVEGYNTVYKRREVGVHAIRRLEKDDVRLLSHQIPARKLSDDEVPARLKDFWELDPALLPLDDL
ncbi:hypothetical protein JCGZ_25528 [Jatropha curcas]|uniref:J domain-containing protein n=1 Tax=Jatropha curcas TaxID=180498 RepID=A0A067JL33_JATCU|nr:uncharacterized protein LOC105646505 [Jatropha curcas]XP_012087753.1 uncharacterized protein LOC105646505 [Jatropha curcas]XP_020539947.1 uncharacterized protein LOC105646505 [Jatropha curcas]XP_020539948.1 uncharacterized protein LOC105646505 [Jatropha curcas]XP_020539949.1 uncharacterized protein LOC105646505 [Jatropha curcas]KDP24612.1 hypothetical protein JCGZ_25528 [Jatropha curcas]